MRYSSAQCTIKTKASQDSNKPEIVLHYNKTNGPDVTRIYMKYEDKMMADGDVLQHG